MRTKKFFLKSFQNHIDLNPLIILLVKHPKIAIETLNDRLINNFMITDCFLFRTTYSYIE